MYIVAINANAAYRNCATERLPFFQVNPWALIL